MPHNAHAWTSSKCHLWLWERKGNTLITCFIFFCKVDYINDKFIDAPTYTYNEFELQLHLVGVFATLFHSSLELYMICMGNWNKTPCTQEIMKKKKGVRIFGTFDHRLLYIYYDFQFIMINASNTYTKYKPWKNRSLLWLLAIIFFKARSSFQHCTRYIRCCMVIAPLMCEK